MGQRREIVEVEMPDGTVIHAEVTQGDDLVDVARRDVLRLGDARSTIQAFVRWTVDGVRSALEVTGEAGSGSQGGDGHQGGHGNHHGGGERQADRAQQEGRQPRLAPPGMQLSGVGVEFGLKLAIKSGKITSVLAEAGAEATAVIRLDWAPAPVPALPSPAAGVGDAAPAIS